MPLINCEVNLILNWSANCLIVYTNVANRGATFEINETHIYVSVVTLSTQDNAKVLSQLKSRFNKYLSKPELLRRKFIEPSFQGVSIIFVLAFKNDAQRTSNKKY